MHKSWWNGLQIRHSDNCIQLSTEQSACCVRSGLCQLSATSCCPPARPTTAFATSRQQVIEYAEHQSYKNFPSPIFCAVYLEEQGLRCVQWAGRALVRDGWLVIRLVAPRPCSPTPRGRRDWTRPGAGRPSCRGSAGLLPCRGSCAAAGRVICPPARRALWNRDSD